jgi:hypothetical protein
MLARLTRTKRRRAGWFVALAYLFCVLAPTLSFSLPGGHAIAYCLTEDEHMPGLIHVHNEGRAQHVHGNGHVHDHSKAHVHAVGDPDAKHVAVSDSFSPAKAPQLVDGKCCGLMCVTALPAADGDIAKPLLPKVVRVSENHRKLTDNAPARLYRPPNS